MADIFISYSQKDRERVERLVDALTAEGYEVWWDLKIRAGESFDQLIEGTLDRVSCVVGVWSKNSVESEWVRAECAWAKDQQVFVSLRIDDDARLPLKFYNVHTPSLTGWDGSRTDAAYQSLLHDIQTLAGVPRRIRDAGRGGAAPEGHRGSAPPDKRERATESTAVAEGSVEVSSELAPREPQSQSGPETQARPPSRPTANTGNRSATPSETKRQLPRWTKTVILVTGVGGVLGLLSLVIPQLRQQPASPPSTVSEPPGLAHDEVMKLPEDRKGKVSPGKSEAATSDLELPEMVTIPAGKFQMGCVSGKGCSKDELPVRTVTFDQPFAIGKYEVTFAEYDRFAEATGRDKPDDQGWGRGNRPVIEVSWDDAVAYTKWLSDQKGHRYRLPTEAEWEYATRAGTTTPFSTGECIDTEQANYDGNYGWEDCPKTGVWRGKTVEVGTLPANPRGLHEVHGNVWEWVQDCWHGSYTDAPKDGSAWEEQGGGECGRRVVRGGSWDSRPEYLRSAYRGGFPAGGGSYFIGFRLAQDL